MYLHFSKVFETTSHSVLGSKWAHTKRLLDGIKID